MSGERPELGDLPQRVAWRLENIATTLGWPQGMTLGSESELLNALQVSREAFREAIRIVERRGSMRMLRGCHGGLSITRPNLNQTT
ncbi:MAG: GntR family transcriptional regulator, partial [Sphingomonas sp.]